jgi:hypothetical protein
MLFLHYTASAFGCRFALSEKRGVDVKSGDVELLKRTVGPMLKEHLDAYVIVGYTADGHRRIVATDFGKDPSCGDGLQIMAAAAERWQEGGLNRPHGNDGQMSFAKE